MKSIILFVLVAFIVCVRCGGSYVSNGGNRYLREACRVTRFQSVCVRSLAPYTNFAKGNTRRWALAAVGVTMREARDVSMFLNGLKQHVRFRRRQSNALADCIELIQDSIDNLIDSLGELKKLDARTFEFQIENVETWMSAALTDEDTCLDGFNGHKGKRVRMLLNKIVKVSEITSNALAIVTKLASHRH